MNPFRASETEIFVTDFESQKYQDAVGKNTEVHEQGVEFSPNLISFVLPLYLQILTNTKINTKTENTGTKSTRRTRKKTGKNPSTVIGEENVFVG